MCRLFGSSSVHNESILKPFLDDINSLCVQSQEHRDGWGIAYFHHGAPHVFRSVARAGADENFRTLAMSLTSTKVIGHLRRATQGEISLLNTHPFQFGNWVFAHNGDLPEFSSIKSELCEGVAEEILAHVFGSTDSEIYFSLFLQALNQEGLLHADDVAVDVCAKALRAAVARVEHVYARRGINKPYALNVVVSNGKLFVAYRQGHSLFYRYRSDEPVRLTICSEPLNKDEGFLQMSEKQLVGVDGKQTFYESL